MKKPPAPAHTLSRMEIEPADNGGMSITHYYKNEPKVSRGRMGGGFDMGYVEPTKHIFGKGESKKVTAHISKHLGLSDAKEEAEEARDE